MSNELKEKIKKLSQITTANGSTLNEVSVARKQLTKLKKQLTKEQNSSRVKKDPYNNYPVNIRFSPFDLEGTWPGHLIALLAIKHNLKLELGETPYEFDANEGHTYILCIKGFETDIQYFRRTYWLLHYEIELMLKEYHYLDQRKLLQTFLGQVRQSMPTLPKLKIEEEATNSVSFEVEIGSTFSLVASKTHGP